MLLISKILEDTEFKGGILIWAIGIPVLTIHLLLLDDPRNKLLTLSISDVKSADQIEGRLKYLLVLMGTKEEYDKNQDILLRGFIQHHAETCTIPSCPIIYKEIVEEDRGIQKKKRKTTENEQDYSSLIEYINRQYKEALTKFYNSASLRISFAFFILEYLQVKHAVMEQFKIAQQKKPQLDEQFNIYRYRKVIEDEISTNFSKEGGLDIVGALIYEDLKKKFLNSIEVNVQFHVEF